MERCKHFVGEVCGGCRHEVSCDECARNEGCLECDLFVTPECPVNGEQWGLEDESWI